MTNSRSKPLNPQNTSYHSDIIKLPPVTDTNYWNGVLLRMSDDAKIALIEEIIEDDFDGNAAAFSRHKGVNKGLVSRALNKGYIAPAISRAMGWPIKVEVSPCPYCGDKAHTYNCQEQVVKPAPKAPRPKRKRTPYKNIDPTNPEQVGRQIAKYMPGWKLVKDE